MLPTVKRTPGTRQRPTKLIVALLALLTVVVVALAAVALGQRNSVQSQGIPTSAAPSPKAELSPTITPSEEPSQAPEPTPTETEEPETQVIAAVAPDRFITPVTDKVLVRSMVGSCQQPGTLEFSQDSGNTWTQSSSLAATDSAMHLRVIPTRANMIQLVALDTDCEPQLVRTQDQGATWLDASDPTGAWFFNPEEPETVSGPDGPVPAPCSAIALSASADNAAVLCDDSTIITTTDKAATWNEPISVPGAVALSFSDNDYVVGIANQNQCAGLQTVELTDSTISSPSSCLEAELQEGTVAVARTSNTVMAWFGNEFATSSDGGNKWN